MNEMLEMLLKHRAISLEKLLLLSYREFDLSEQEAVVLMLVSHLESIGAAAIDPYALSNYMQLSISQIDETAFNLVQRGFLTIDMDKNSYSAKPAIQKVLNKTDIKKKEIQRKQKERSLVEMFEHEFARGLTPIEMETIKQWKQVGFDDEMIKEALKEASLSNVHNMRYINKILSEWAKHGMSASSRQKVETAKPEVELVDYPWWEEE